MSAIRPVLPHIIDRRNDEPAVSKQMRKGGRAGSYIQNGSRGVLREGMRRSKTNSTGRSLGLNG
jgi:hypothetical protein